MRVAHENYRAGHAWVRRIERARSLRHDSTDAERALWKVVPARQIGGLKFRRQHEFGGFVLDFYCAEICLAIEVDGGQHFSTDAAARDTERSKFLEANGIRVLRLTNAEVLGQIDAVLEAIWREVQGG